MKNILLKTLIVFLLSILLLCCTSCKLTSNEKVSLSTAEIKDNISFNYDSVNNETKVVWSSTIKNDTSYNIKDFSITFKLYNNGSQIDTQTYTYDHFIRYKDETTSSFTFYYNGKITNAEFYDFKTTKETLWATYSLWIIITFVVAVILSIILILMVIFNDFSLGDILEYWYFIFFIPILGIGGLVSKFLINSLIIVCGLIFILIVVLLTSGIKSIIEEISF